MQLVGDLVVGASGQYLGAGMQDGQRRPQLVGGVGDESSLQGKRVGERANRAAREQQHHRGRGGDPGSFGEGEGEEQPVAAGVEGLQVE